MSHIKLRGRDHLHFAVARHLQEHLGRAEAFRQDARAVSEGDAEQVRFIRKYVLDNMLPSQPPVDQPDTWIEIDPHLHRAVTGHMEQELGEAKMREQITALAHDGRAALVRFVRSYVAEHLLPAEPAAQKAELAATRPAVARRPIDRPRRADRS